MLEVVDSFKYLGSTVTTNNDMTEEIKIRISSASKCSWAMKEVLNSRILSRRTKLQAYTAILRPIATYACETWSLTKEQERMLLVFEHKILRRILGRVRDENGEWRIRHNAELRELTGLAPITSFVRAQRLRWAGHVARLPDGSMTKEVARGTPFGPRPPGRPRSRWADNVRADLAALDVPNPEDWWNLAQDQGCQH